MESGLHDTAGRPRTSSPRWRAILLRIPPPLLFVAAFLVGMAVQRYLPLPLPGGGHEPVLEGAGAVLLALGIVLGPLNALMFLARRTTLDPAAAPRRFFTGGAYRISRNPMYIGVLLVYTGVALLNAQPWALLLITLPFAAVQRVYIPREEERMAQAFGADYEAYRRRVRRWVGLVPSTAPGPSSGGRGR